MIDEANITNEAKDFIELFKNLDCVGVSIEIKKDLPVTVNKEYSAGRKCVTANLIDLINAEDLTVVLTRIDELTANGSGSLRVTCRFVPENRRYLICCEMNREKRLGKTVDTLFGVIIDVDELNKGIAADPAQQELLTLKKNMEKFSASSENDKDIVEIVGIEQLLRIQIPLANYNGIHSALFTENGKFICSHDPAQTNFDVKKYKYTRQVYIKINRVIYAVWVIAADDKSLIDWCAPAHDILAESLSKITNSFVMLYNEMVNSEHANKMLSETIEQQILLNGIYSRVINEHNTAETTQAVLNMTGSFLNLDRILIYESVNKDGFVRVNDWWNPKDGKDGEKSEPPPVSPSYFIRNDYTSLSEKLDAYETYFSNNPKHNVLGLPFSSYVASNLNANGLKYGIVIYIIDNSAKVLSHAEKRLLRSVSQIIAGVALRCKDNKELRESNRKLLHLAYFDAKLSVKNKASLNLDIDEAVQSGLNGAVVAFKITNMKSIIKFEGHECCDKLLIKVMDFIRSYNQSPNELYRIEPYRFSDKIFMVLLRNSDAVAVKAFCDALMERFSRPWQVNLNNEQSEFKERYLEITAGAALYPNAGTTYDELCRTAEMSMDKAKIYGINSYAFYSGEYEPRRDDDYYCAQILRDAVENNMDGVDVRYLPVYQSGERKIVSYEAFPMISDYMDLGMYPTHLVMNIAEKMEIDSVIDSWVITQACEFCVKARESSPEITVSVSVSALSLITDEIVFMVKKALDKSGLAPDGLSLQFSEKIAAIHYDKFMNVLPKLKKIGVSVILDSVGSYYITSSLLRHSAISAAKADVTVLSTRIDEFTDTYILGLMKLAKENGVAVGVKSVDNESRLEGKIADNIDWYQGGFYNHPVSADKALNMLEPVNITGKT